MSAFVQVRSGAVVDLLLPDADALHLHDIAHHLSLINRWVGATRFPFSVAQHCCLCSENAPRHLEWDALMHDAAEFVLGDVSRPLKALLPEYKILESVMERALADKFQFTPGVLVVKTLDCRSMATEYEDLMVVRSDFKWFSEDCFSWDEPIQEMRFREARRKFWNRAVRAAPRPVAERAAQDAARMGVSWINRHGFAMLK